MPWAPACVPGTTTGGTVPLAVAVVVVPGGVVPGGTGTVGDSRFSSAMALRASRA
jgi:hypothetical protein